MLLIHGVGGLIADGLITKWRICELSDAHGSGPRHRAGVQGGRIPLGQTSWNTKAQYRDKSCTLYANK